jgi:phospholipid/cholesterol/gamma-HCH transport system substrate-binding protein
METRANYVVVGLFTLAVMAGGFGFVYWFSRTADGGERAIYRAVFDGAVSGLRTGG